MSNDQTIAGLDLVIIVAFLLGILTPGVWVSHKRRTTPTEYFLAGEHDAVMNIVIDYVRRLSEHERALVLGETCTKTYNLPK